MREEGREREQKLFGLFKLAVEKEREAQSMYAEALGLCTDPTMRRVLQQLYDEEVRHEQQMMQYYKELRGVTENRE